MHVNTSLGPLYIIESLATFANFILNFDFCRVSYYQVLKRSSPPYPTFHHTRGDQCRRAGSLPAPEENGKGW